MKRQLRALLVIVSLLAAMRDVEVSPSSSSDQALSKFLLGLVKVIGRKQ